MISEPTVFKKPINLAKRDRRPWVLLDEVEQYDKSIQLALDIAQSDSFLNLLHSTRRLKRDQKSAEVLLLDTVKGIGDLSDVLAGADEEVLRKVVKNKKSKQNIKDSLGLVLLDMIALADKLEIDLYQAGMEATKKKDKISINKLTTKK